LVQKASLVYSVAKAHGTKMYEVNTQYCVMCRRLIIYFRNKSQKMYTTNTDFKKAASVPHVTFNTDNTKRQASLESTHTIYVIHRCLRNFFWL